MLIRKNKSVDPDCWQLIGSHAYAQLIPPIKTIFNKKVFGKLELLYKCREITDENGRQPVNW
jgi:hypothetical protein